MNSFPTSEAVFCKKLTVAVIGCGRVAEHHLKFIKQSPFVSEVALVDNNKAAVERLGKKFGITNRFDSLDALFSSIKVDVLHVTTPPEYHFKHAMAAIEEGINVLIEKPTAPTYAEVEALYKRAKEKQVLICPDFIQLFHPKMIKALMLINSGKFGRVIHVETHLETDADLEAMRESTKPHWSWNLPGGILHDYLPHPFYLTLHFTGEPKRTSVIAKNCGVLPQGLTDHLNVSIDGENCTASVLLSMAIQPRRYYIQVFCEKGSVTVDFDTMNIVERNSHLEPSTLARFTRDIRVSVQLLLGTFGTAVGLLRKKVVSYQGLQLLLHRFYSSILLQTEAPISARLALITAKSEEAVISAAGRLHLNTSDRPSKQTNVQHSGTILVTGATGYLGREVCRHLVNEGYRVRAMVRPLSKIEPLEELGIELTFGDVRDAAAVNRAVQGTHVIIHLAADITGSPESILESCQRGTKNIAEAARAAGCGRVIYVSSFAIYDYTELKNGDVIDEQSPLEPSPEHRGVASQGKRLAEDIALAQLQQSPPSWTILRPSLIVGNGRDVYQMIGYKVSKFLFAIGSKKLNLKLVHVSDVAEAIRIAMKHESTKGKVFNLSISTPINVGQYIQRYIPKDSVSVVYVRYWFARMLQIVFKTLHLVVRRSPNIHIRRLNYLFRDTQANSNSFTAATGWSPSTDLQRQTPSLKRPAPVEQTAAAGK